eukprot:TRINITY_DN18860_c0_g1_i1.p1 TRINITY_DN18860_c0_g1~~TRINITY_DN18860_c0_g1_i1.p1  ORF type:complete len:388 (+),score=60.88 TRINITY_DN18860_c0_g1_i1:128-1165(+)
MIASAGSSICGAARRRQCSPAFARADEVRDRPRRMSWARSAYKSRVRGSWQHSLAVLLGLARLCSANLSSSETGSPTPSFLVEVNSVPVTLELDVQWMAVALDVEHFRETVIHGLAETLSLAPERIDIERIRLKLPEDFVEDAPPVDKVEGTTTLDFNILDPPVVLGSPELLYTAEEKADRLHALVAAQTRSAWKGDVLRYIQGASCELFKARKITVAEAQFGSSPINKHPIRQEFQAPGGCTCVNQSSSPPIERGCAEHHGLSPSEDKSQGLPWCVVVGVCQDAKQGFSTGWWIPCEEDKPPVVESRGRMVASSGKSGSASVPSVITNLIAAVCLAVLLSVSAQ